MEMDRNKTEESPPSIKWLVVLFVSGAVLILIAIAIPSYVGGRGYGYCNQVEADAHHIAAAIGEYFANPTHADIHIKPDDLRNLDSIQNPWTITTCGDKIWVHVADGSGKCPSEIQSRMPQWQSGMFTLSVLD